VTGKILQQQMLTLSDVAVCSRLTGTTTPEVILNIFLPFTKPSMPGKNVGSC
jgi:hypothetical protein